MILSLSIHSELETRRKRWTSFFPIKVRTTARKENQCSRQSFPELLKNELEGSLVSRRGAIRPALLLLSQREKEKYSRIRVRLRESGEGKREGRREEDVPSAIR